MSYPYAEAADVLFRYPPITTIVGSDSTEVTTVQINSIYIADAQSYIDAFLRARYVTPVVAEPIIVQVTTDIAIYRMVEDHAPRIPDLALSRWTAANSLLMMLRDGTMLLDPNSQTLVTCGGDQDIWSTDLEQCGPVFRAPERFPSGRDPWSFEENFGCNYVRTCA